MQPRLKPSSQFVKNERHSPDLNVDYLQYHLQATSRIKKLDQKDYKPATKYYNQVISSYIKSINFRKHPILSNKWNLNYLTESMTRVFTRSSILFSIDVEAWEQNSQTVTEIGIAIYDPREQASALLPSITQIHIRISEAITLSNGRFVPDHALNANSGRSYLLDRQGAAEFVQVLVNYYFGVVPTDRLKTLLVGHNVKGDVQWLKKFGIVFNPDQMETLDTQKLFSLSNGESGASLKNGLRAVEIPHAYLHNAGNDAYFTLLLAMKLCDPLTRQYYSLDEEFNPTPQPTLSKNQRRRKELSAPNEASSISTNPLELIETLYSH